MIDGYVSDKEWSLNTNADVVLRKFQQLTYQEIKKTIVTALSKGSREVRKTIRGVLVQKLPNATKKNPKYTDRLTDGVVSHANTRKLANTNENATAIVHIMGSRKSTSGTYRLRFYELGAEGRETKKGKSRGSIPQLNFFAEGLAIGEPKHKQIVMDELQKAIDNINKTNIG